MTLPQRLSAMADLFWQDTAPAARRSSFQPSWASWHETVLHEVCHIVTLGWYDTWSTVPSSSFMSHAIDELPEWMKESNEVLTCAVESRILIDYRGQTIAENNEFITNLARDLDALPSARRRILELRETPKVEYLALKALRYVYKHSFEWRNRCRIESRRSSMT